MVQADAVADESLQILADRGVEPEATHFFAHGGLFVLVEHVQAAQVLSLLGSCLLGEVNDVDGRPVSVDQIDDRLVEGGLAVLERQRDRSDGVSHGHRGAASAVGEVLGEAGRRSEGGRHQQELGIGQF